MIRWASLPLCVLRSERFEHLSPPRARDRHSQRDDVTTKLDDVIIQYYPIRSNAATCAKNRTTSVAKITTAKLQTIVRVPSHGTRIHATASYSGFENH